MATFRNRLTGTFCRSIGVATLAATALYTSTLYADDEGGTTIDNGSTIDCAVTSNGEPVDGIPLCEDLYPQEAYAHPTSPWRFGLGVGYGQRSNPLINSDNVPIYAVVSLSYFGERFFFDNGDLGWRLGDYGNVSVNVIAGVGGERTFYSFLNKSSVSVLDNFAPTEPGVQLPTEPTEHTPEAPDRDFAIDGGLELLYSTEHLDLQLQALTDISDKHNGQQLWFSAGRSIQAGRLLVEPSAGFTWQSGDTANYYFGVRENEAMDGLAAYKAGQALNPFIRLSMSYRLSNHWQLVATGQYEFLDDEIADSSSVKDDHVSTVFAGVYYEF